MYLLIQFTNKLDDNLKLNERNENVNAKAIKTRLKDKNNLSFIVSQYDTFYDCFDKQQLFLVCIYNLRKK